VGEELNSHEVVYIGSFTTVLNSRAGAGGCPLAKTLVDGGQKVLLIERGKERNPVTYNIKTSGAALQDECAEKFSSDGVVLAVGNCMGGT
jgi:hypothetical protein